MAKTYELKVGDTPERMRAIADPGSQQSPLGWAFALTLGAALLGWAGSVLSWAPKVAMLAATEARNAQTSEPSLWGPSPLAPQAGSGLVPGAARSSSPVSTVAVRWEGAELVIEARAATLAEVAPALAIHTGSQLLGDVAALQHDRRPLTLQWRARDLQTAWSQLLQAQLSYATQCGGAACRVWVLGALQADKMNPVQHAAANGAARRAGKREFATDPPGLFPAD